MSNQSDDNSTNLDFIDSSPLNSILGEISGLDLLPLAEIDDYHPPSLSKLFIIDHVTSTIKLQPGVNALNLKVLFNYRKYFKKNFGEPYLATYIFLIFN